MVSKFCSKAASEYKEYISTSTSINSVFSKNIFLFLLGFWFFGFVICWFWFLMYFDVLFGVGGRGGVVLVWFYSPDYRLSTQYIFSCTDF